MGLREFKRSQNYSDYILKQNHIIIDKQNPQEILDLFCHSIFKSHVNTILYFQLHPTKDPTPNYIINMAEYLRIPVISWDSEFPGALQVGLFFINFKTVLSLYDAFTTVTKHVTYREGDLFISPVPMWVIRPKSMNS
jgi:hypothetical protein